MEAKHTPGQLFYQTGKAAEGSFYAVVDSAGNLVWECYNGQSDEEKAANAKRSAACWNRLLPLTTEEIENGIDFVSLIVWIRQARTALEQIVNIGNEESREIARAVLKATK